MGVPYKRIMLKVSGEVLGGGAPGIDAKTVRPICEAIKKVADMGVQTEIVVGGGNFWRGRDHLDIDRSKTDSIGMLATVMNALAFSDYLEKAGVPAKVLTAFDMPKVAELFTHDRAIEALEAGKAVIFACGTGNPCFSTDSGAALRAIETGADVYFKSTNVDGVYDKDPNKHSDAVMYDRLRQTDILKNELGVMDATAAALCRENGLKALVFNLNDPENIVRAARGEKIGTIIDPD